jgi:hypothetical protein
MAAMLGSTARLIAQTLAAEERLPIDRDPKWLRRLGGNGIGPSTTRKGERPQQCGQRLLDRKPSKWRPKYPNEINSVIDKTLLASFWLPHFYSRRMRAACVTSAAMNASLAVAAMTLR